MTKRQLSILLSVWFLGITATLGGGVYQLTKDGAVSVWNNYPKPGDEAEWTGGKDNDGYATGEGELTWYKSGVFMSRYTGRMTRGRLDGVVTNRDASGATYRGTYVSGTKSGDWQQIPAEAVGGAAPPRESLGAFLKRREAEIVAAYQSVLASHEGAAKEKVRIAQRAWIVFSNKNEAAAGLAGGRRGLTRVELIREAASEVEARTLELRNFFSLPNQDLAACRRDFEVAEREQGAVFQKVIATLAPDEVEKLNDAQRAWVDFREKSAESHAADPSGRAPLWDRVIINRRRAQELQSFYLTRISGGPAQPPPSYAESSATPQSAPTADSPPSPSAVEPVVTVAVATPQPTVGIDAVQQKMIDDFKTDTKILLANIATASGGFRKISDVKAATPLPPSASDAISRASDKSREFRARIGYAEALRECPNETAIVDGLIAYDQALRALHAGDAPAADAAVNSFLRDHRTSATEELKPLWSALESLQAAFSGSSKEAAQHVEKAQILTKNGKTSEALQEYEIANGIFPDPKVSRTVKQLKEDSLGL